MHGYVWSLREIQEDESIATIPAAVDQRVTLLDTGDFYGGGGNEMLIGRARLIVPSWL